MKHMPEHSISPVASDFFLAGQIRGYHPGTWGGVRPFKILIVSGAEASYLKEHAVVVSDITDAAVQIHRTRRISGWAHAGRLPDVRKASVGFVQDTEGARSVLAEGGFMMHSPHLYVREDPVGASMY